MTDSKMRTCTMMVYTDGTVSRYAVMQGKMRRSRKGESFNAHRAEIVAIYEVTGAPDYRAMTARHATPMVPAISWQA